jgi:hypothetical protein
VRGLDRRRCFWLVVDDENEETEEIKGGNVGSLYVLALPQHLSSLWLMDLQMTDRAGTNDDDVYAIVCMYGDSNRTRWSFYLTTFSQ